MWRKLISSCCDTIKQSTCAEQHSIQFWAVFFFNLSTAFSSVAFSNNRVNLTTAPEVKVGVYSMLLFGDVKHAN